MWDAFISHASEDKDTLVAPLASMLKELGAKVWYDEFELKAGDSLSKSIDKGLVNSRYGIVVLSPSFINKGWPDYELRSLISKEIGKDGIIIPIWHNITQQSLMEFSPYLADKLALKSDIGIEKLAIKLLEKIKPEIANSYLTMMALRELGNTAEVHKINIHDIKERECLLHQELSPHVVMLSIILCDLFCDVLKMSHLDFVMNLCKDADYEREIAIWCAMASTYLLFARKFNLDTRDKKKKHVIVSTLLSYSLGNISVDDMDDIVQSKLLNENEIVHLLRLFEQNMEVFRDYAGLGK